VEGDYRYHHYIGGDLSGEGAETGRNGANNVHACPDGYVVVAIVWYEASDYGDNIGIKCQRIQ